MPYQESPDFGNAITALDSGLDKSQLTWQNSATKSYRVLRKYLKQIARFSLCFV